MARVLKRAVGDVTTEPIGWRGVKRSYEPRNIGNLHKLEKKRE
jgi:hypothetical protein